MISELSECRHAAGRAGKRHPCELVRRLRVVHERPRRRQPERCIHNICISRYTGVETVAGLGNLLLSEAKSLTGSVELLARRGQIQYCSADIGLRLLLEVVLADLCFLYD